MDKFASAALLAISVVLLAAWPGWRAEPAQDYVAETPESFLARAEAYAAGHGDLVKPPPGATVPVLARRFEFWPNLELLAGQPYRLELSSVDGVHALVLAGHELLLVPGQVRILDFVPDRTGPLEMRCNEYCGLGHNRMRGQVHITSQQTPSR